MDVLTDILLASGLSMDSAAVSMAWGAGTKEALRSAMLAAIFFGTVQAAMFAAGGLGGEAVKSGIEAYDHWLAFALLGVVGVRMVISALSGKGRAPAAPSGVSGILALALATSIDAVGAGAGLAFAENSIVQSAIIVGCVTAAISFGGVLLGGYGGKALGARMSVLGGLVLIGIGLRILLSHYGF